MDLEKYKLIILDADGTLRRCTVPGQPCPHEYGEWELMPHVKEVMSRLPDRTKLAIVSNQGGVGLGFLSETMAWTLLIDLAYALDLDFARYSLHLCPHTPDAGCLCRKPAPLMLFAAMIKANICFLTDVLYVGDLESDRACAERAGVDFIWAQEFFGWEDGDVEAMTEGGKTS